MGPFLNPSPTLQAAAATAAAGRKKLSGNHLSPLWNKTRDIRVFGRHVVFMSISEAAGHLSFLFLGLGFLEKDLLPLRAYAAAGERAGVMHAEQGLINCLFARCVLSKRFELL